MKQATILVISKGDRQQYSYTLIRPSDQPFGRAAMRVWHADVDAGVLTLLCRKMGEAVDAATASPFTAGIGVQPLADLGKALYDTLIPRGPLQDLRREIQNLQTPVLISTDQPDVLWEHLHDGEGDGFLGLKLDIGRSLRAEDAGSWPEPRRGPSWRCLLIADPTGDLDAAGEEAAALRQWLSEHGVECAYLAGAAATHEAVVSQLLREHDIIHYTGHVDFGTYALRLADHDLPPLAIERLVRGAPIVFLNGCLSGGAVQGLTDAFLRAGAQAVVGSMFKVPADGAGAFSRKFYELALGGETLGRAMRDARKHVMSRPEYAAAWACFVMYGDPCLRVELKADDLQTALAQIAFNREDFEKDCGKVVQRAYEYGRAIKEIGAAHLFAAMVGGPNKHLWDRLRAAGGSPEELQGAFQKAFAEVEGAGSSQLHSQRGPSHNGPFEGVSFSANAAAILKKARETADQGKITELDLVRGFVRSGGGSAGEILRHLDVDLRDLDPDAPAPPPQGSRAPNSRPQKVGPLVENECDPGVWDVLIAATNLAGRTGSSVVGTPHLFGGLLENPDGLLAKKLRRVGLAVDARTLFAPTRRPVTLGAEPPCSSNTSEILVLAQANAAAARRPMSEGDLLGAFVQNGGGNTGRLLEKTGLNLRLLGSELFQSDGSLDLSRFDAASQEVLSNATDFAAQKGHAVLGRRHLLYGMLSLDRGFLASRIREQQRDPEQLADLLRAETPSGNSSQSRAGFRYGAISGDLVRILCAAEVAASGPIDDRSLARAWLEDGGGDAGRLLAQYGVRLLKLM
jgi:hypothetical protein